MPAPLTLAYLADPNSVHTRRWLAFFVERGHAVHLLIGEGDSAKPGLAAGVTLHRYRRFGRRRLPLASSLQGRRALREALRQIEPDVLHAHYLTRHGWQARLSGFHPYVVSPWGSDLFVTPRESLRARIWARLTLRGADLVTVVSDHMREAVLRHGVRPGRIERVSFGVDTERFHPADTAGSLADALGIEEGRRFVFSPRAIRPIYRPDVVVTAAASLPADVALVMTGRNADPGTLAETRARVDALGIADRVRIVDEIDDDLMLALFQRAALVVSVPESDAIPISVLETMACARPVVASDLPGPRELLGAVEPRLLAPVGDAIATAAAMRAVLEMSPADSAALGGALRERVVADEDHRRNMERMEELYRGLSDHPR